MCVKDKYCAVAILCERPLLADCDGRPRYAGRPLWRFQPEFVI